MRLNLLLPARERACSEVQSWWPLLGTCWKSTFSVQPAVWRWSCGTPDRPVFINPRRACAARVTVVGSVCLSVCLLSHISPLERLFVLKTLSRTQRATKVKKFVGFSLKPLRCRDPALPPLTAIRTAGHFSCGKRHACAL